MRHVDLGSGPVWEEQTVGSSISDCFHDLHHYGQENHHLVSSRWRLRWPSQETLLRFVDLVRALHSKVAASLIRVEFSPSPLTPPAFIHSLLYSSTVKQIKCATSITKRWQKWNLNYNIYKIFHNPANHPTCHHPPPESSATKLGEAPTSPATPSDYPLEKENVSSLPEHGAPKQQTSELERATKTQHQRRRPRVRRIRCRRHYRPVHHRSILAPSDEEARIMTCKERRTNERARKKAGRHCIFFLTWISSCNRGDAIEVASPRRHPHAPIVRIKRIRRVRLHRIRLITLLPPATAPRNPPSTGRRPNPAPLAASSHPPHSSLRRMSGSWCHSPASPPLPSNAADTPELRSPETAPSSSPKPARASNPCYKARR